MVVHGRGVGLFGYYTAGERRIHRVQEGELYLLYNAGLALIQLEDEGLTGRYGRMKPEVRTDLEKAVQHARDSITARENFG